MQDKAHIPVTVMEAETVIQFISSAALAKALGEAASVEPQKLFIWITGMEVDLSSAAALRTRHETYTRGFLRMWHQRLAGQNAAKNVKELLDKLERERWRDLGRVEAAFGAGNYINSAQDRLMRSSIRAMSRLKVRELLSMESMRLLEGGGAVLGLGGLAVPVAKTGKGGAETEFSEEAVLSLVEEWDSTPHAKVLGVSTETQRFGMHDDSDQRPSPKLDKMQPALQQIAENRPLHSKLMRECHEEIEQISRVQKRLADAPRRIEAQKRPVAASVKKGAGRGGPAQARDEAKKKAALQMLKQSSRRVPIVFVAPEIAGALRAYAEEWNPGR
ncbi:MAG: hypothetical protein M9913_18715 [Bryobacteraceae bacterium]|nr:hypothetical protein [Solibacteraceae bacterium]MCL4840680.1 hypothetical protein [Bryobacteraceae bacterium]MCO5352893.1 hypothetical protein [Bryobacteraceae bacterium]